MHILFLRLFLICCVTFLIYHYPLQAQTLSYGIYKGDEQIGKLKVEKFVRDGKTFYTSDSESHFNVVFISNEFITQSRAEFVDDVLDYCMAQTMHNGKIRDHSITRRSKDGYEFFKHPEEKNLQKHPPVTLSTLNLYFLEPKGVDRIFSENYQKFCPVKPIGENTYEVILPGEKINHYVYENGRLVEIKVFRTFVDLSFRFVGMEG